MNRTSLASRPCPRMSQVSQSTAASRASVVADDVHAAPTTTSAPMAPPASTVRTEVARRMSGIASAAASATAPAAIAWPPSSVAGQPTPATVTAAAPSGRRAATKSATAATKPKIAQEDERVHLRVLRRLEGQEDLVEVDDPARRVAQRRREDALVAERQELPRLRAEGNPGSAECREDDSPDAHRSTTHERGNDCEHRDGQALADEPRIFQAQPRRRDGECRKQRREERSTHEPPPRTTAPTARLRDRLHA